MALRAIRRLVEWEMALPPHVTFLILYPDRMRHSIDDWYRCALSHRAMVNHERSHSRTLKNTNEWHVKVDDYMWTWFGNEWDACLIALLERPGAYRDMLAKVDDDPDHVAWLASEEIIARLHAMMHAPRDSNARWYIATRELSNNPQALMDLVERVEKHWDTPEQLVGWLDSYFAESIAPHQDD